MTKETIIHGRLLHQQILTGGHGAGSGGGGFTRPEDLVHWMGCIQAQDFAGAKWALGCRLRGETDATIQDAFNAGKFLRVHVLRPTWHFVTPEDIRWMLELTAPRIKAMAAGQCRQLELDETIFRRSHKALEKALEGGRQLTRKELLPVFGQAKIRADDLRLTYLLMQAEVDGIICSGALAGKQFTYALLEERAPAGRKLKREEGIGQLALRYFRSRGPATLHDFAWWSGLTVTDAKMGMELNRSDLEKVETGGQVYYSGAAYGGMTGMKDLPEIAGAEEKFQATGGMYILPAYDEFSVAYTDRELILPAKHAPRGGNGIFRPIIVRDGQIVGLWQRTIHKDHITVETDLFKPLGKKVLRAAFAPYAEFMGKKVLV